MAYPKHSTARLALTALVLLAELAHLAWQHFDGGVVSHNLGNRADWPAISNWWGAAVLPAVTWFLTGRIARRIAAHPRNPGAGAGARIPGAIAAGFLAALAFGVVLSLAFTFDYTAVSSTMFFGVLALALVLPLYRAENVLGFILGMAFTFGGVLPVLIGSLIAAIAAVFGFGVHPALAGLVRRARRGRAIDPARGRGTGAA